MREGGLVMKKILYWAEQITFYVGLLIAGYAFFRIYVSRKGLPPEACPVDDNRVWIYTAIGCLFISIILSYIQKQQNNKSQGENQKK